MSAQSRAIKPMGEKEDGRLKERMEGGGGGWESGELIEQIEGLMGNSTGAAVYREVEGAMERARGHVTGQLSAVSVDGSAATSSGPLLLAGDRTTPLVAALFVTVRDLLVTVASVAFNADGDVTGVTRWTRELPSEDAHALSKRVDALARLSAAPLAIVDAVAQLAEVQLPPLHTVYRPDKRGSDAWDAHNKRRERNRKEADKRKAAAVQALDNHMDARWRFREDLRERGQLPASETALDRQVGVILRANDARREAARTASKHPDLREGVREALKEAGGGEEPAPEDVDEEVVRMLGRIQANRREEKERRERRKKERSAKEQRDAVVPTAVPDVVEQPEKEDLEQPQDPQDPHDAPKEMEEEPKEQPLAPPTTPQQTRHILKGRRSGVVPQRADVVHAAAAAEAPVETDATEEYAAPIEYGDSPDHREHSPPMADFHDDDVDGSLPGTPPSRRRSISAEDDEHTCSPLKRSRLAMDVLQQQLDEAVAALDDEKALHRSNRRAGARDAVLLMAEWEARASSRADTYRLAAEVEALEAEVEMEKARADAAEKAAIVIAAAAAVAAAVQPVPPAPAVAGAPVVLPGPAPNAQFVADMAEIKTRLLSYLTAPGVVTKINGKASDRLSKEWKSLTITAGKRLTKVKEVAAIGAARITADTVADPAHLGQLTDFFYEATVTLNEYDELLERVEAFGANIVAEHDRTGRKVAWSKSVYGDNYTAIKKMSDEDLEGLKDFGESCKALPLPL